MNIMAAVTLLITAFSALLAVPASSAAAAAACATDIRSAQYVTYRGQASDSSLGAVQLREDNCGNYWAYVQIYGGALTSNEYAQAWVSRWDNGVRTAIYSCDSPGGNGHVKAGETTCVTPKIRSRNSSSLFIASAHYYHRTSSTGPWIDEYWGQTPAVR
ncbi:hypothetical protein [Micromonospora sp. DT31]|uniref:hypothetical protein n=1 Tax=Micromonospora sp. DT31 TaxID=3393434 RepID=UPI003CEF2844